MLNVHLIMRQLTNHLFVHTTTLHNRPTNTTVISSHLYHNWSWRGWPSGFLFQCLWCPREFLCMCIAYYINRLTEVSWATITSHVPYHHIAVSCTWGKDNWGRKKMTLLILFTSLLVLLIAICEDLRWFYRQNSGLDSTLWILTKTNHYQQQNCKINCSNLGVTVSCTV